MARLSRIDPWFVDQIAQLVELRAELVDGARPHAGPAAQGETARPVGPAARRAAAGAGRRGGGAAVALARRNPPGLQDGRHLRRRVRRAHAVPLLVLRRGDRGRSAAVPAEGDHPGQRSQPDRPGHRVRLLLRPRGHRPARGGLRDRDGELQPGDGLDRLRHRRSVVLRTAHPRRRPRSRPRRARVRPGRRSHLHPRWPDPARAGPAVEGLGRARSRHAARGDRPGRASRSLRAGPRGRRSAVTAPRHRDVVRGGEGGGRFGRLPGAGAPVLRPRRARHGDRLRRGDALRVHLAGHRGDPGSSRPCRPVSGRRDRDRCRCAVRRRRAVPRRGHGAHRGGRHPFR